MRFSLSYMSFTPRLGAVQNLDEEKTQKAQLLDRIINYMKKRKLPPYFQRIILDFYSYTSDKHSEDDIFKVTRRTIPCVSV